MMHIMAKKSLLTGANGWLLLLRPGRQPMMTMSAGHNRTLINAALQIYTCQEAVRWNRMTSCPYFKPWTSPTPVLKAVASWTFWQASLQAAHALLDEA